MHVLLQILAHCYSVLRYLACMYCSITCPYTILPVFTTQLSLSSNQYNDQSSGGAAMGPLDYKKTKQV